MILDQFLDHGAAHSMACSPPAVPPVGQEILPNLATPPTSDALAPPAGRLLPCGLCLTKAACEECEPLAGPQWGPVTHWELWEKGFGDTNGVSKDIRAKHTRIYTGT